MNSFTEDLWAIILARLPVKSITTSKLVCKQWKSIVESPYLRDLFLSLHQNSHSSWSLIYLMDEAVPHYGSNTWGLEGSMDFYISSFLTKKFGTQRNRYRVWAFTDVGLILISDVCTHAKNRSLYVANPISQECVEILSQSKEDSRPLGIATRTENGVLLDYKVVLFDYDWCNISLLIYSSETGLWSLNTVHLSFTCLYLNNPISLHGNIHWPASNSDWEDVVVSIDPYAIGTGSLQCRVTPFPDLGKHPRFIRNCTTCQGFLMYMNIIPVTKNDGSLEDKLCVWRLKSEEWQLVSEITPAFMNPVSYYLPLTINPFDDKTVYFWSKKPQSLLSINLRNGMFDLHNELESSKNTRILSSFRSHFISCAFPQWLHRIPVRRVS